MKKAPTRPARAEWGLAGNVPVTGPLQHETPAQWRGSRRAGTRRLLGLFYIGAVRVSRLPVERFSTTETGATAAGARNKRLRNRND